MSLVLGLVVLCLIAGGWLIRHVSEEACWRRDERDAERLLRRLVIAERAREIAEDATADAFARTLEEIQGLDVADPWDVAW